MAAKIKENFMIDDFIFMEWKILFFFNVRSTVLSTRRFLPLIYIWQYLRTSLVVTPWGGNATGIYGQRPGVLQNVATQGHPKPRMSCAVHSHHVWLFAATWTVAHQVPLSMEFSRQEYWSAVPFPTPGDHPTPLASPALADVFFTTVPPGKPRMTRTKCQCQARTGLRNWL